MVILLLKNRDIPQMLNLSNTCSVCPIVIKFTPLKKLLITYPYRFKNHLDFFVNSQYSIKKEAGGTASSQALFFLLLVRYFFLAVFFAAFFAVFFATFFVAFFAVFFVAIISPPFFT
jgi:hypothetical protein